MKHNKISEFAKTGKKVVFNYVPPALINMPSSSFSILKGFLAANGYNSEIIYWNMLLNITNEYQNSEYMVNTRNPSDREVISLLPYIRLLAEDYSDSDAMNKIQAFSRLVLPNYQLSDKKANLFWERVKKRLKRAIEIRLASLESRDILMFGFSSKFHQWIAGMFLADEIKRRFPAIKIVIGGFQLRDDALELLSICRHFDFAIWGEGEYPLLKLCEFISEGNESLEAIPRLAFRGNNNILVGNSIKEVRSTMKYYIPDYGDFKTSLNFVRHSNTDLEYPLEGSRGCSWNRCMFCALNKGYVYSIRPLDDVINEIDLNVPKYEINSYRFVDNDMVGRDLNRFETLLDRLIDLKYKKGFELKFTAEIVHHNFSANLIKKMVLAGFRNVQIGYEAVSDGLLAKMDKRTDFADHLLFIKYSLKYGITNGGVNVLTGIVNEASEDVLESIQNMPYLRFFIRKKSNQFYHNLHRMKLFKGTRYFRMLRGNSRKHWNYHPIAYLLPRNILSEEGRFNLFQYSRELENSCEWEWFRSINEYYEKNEYIYKVISAGARHYYYEYFNARLIEQIVFDDEAYWQVLRLSNEHVTSFNDIYQNMKLNKERTTRRKLMKIINDLNSIKVLYRNQDGSRIVSIIDTDVEN
jgi:radical SAM superfamily enzyme YgiQ (UPF0313 family)